MVGARNAVAPGMVPAQVEELVGLERAGAGTTCRAPRSTYGAMYRPDRATSGRRGSGCSRRPGQSRSARCATVIAIRLRWDSMAPLERPVVPLV